MSLQGAGPAPGTATMEGWGGSVALVTFQQTPSGESYKGAGADRVLLQFK